MIGQASCITSFQSTAALNCSPDSRVLGIQTQLLVGMIIHAVLKLTFKLFIPQLVGKFTR